MLNPVHVFSVDKGQRLFTRNSYNWHNKRKTFSTKQWCLRQAFLTIHYCMSCCYVFIYVHFVSFEMFLFSSQLTATRDCFADAHDLSSHETPSTSFMNITPAGRRSQPNINGTFSTVYSFWIALLLCMRIQLAIWCEFLFEFSC